MAGKSEWQELEAAVHIASAAAKQRTAMFMFKWLSPFYGVQEPSP